MHAEGLDDHDATSLRVSDAMLATFNLTAHDVCPFWNYTLRPRLDAFRAEAETPPTGRPSLTSPKEYYEDKGYKPQDVALASIGTGLAHASALVALSTPLTLWNTIVGSILREHPSSLCARPWLQSSSQPRLRRYLNPAGFLGDSLV